MKKIILSLVLILSFIFVGCSNNANQEEKTNTISEKEVIENYLKVKVGIGNYIANTSFDDNESGEVSDSAYNDGVVALESLNVLIENVFNLPNEIKERLIESNNEMIDYCNARINNDKTSNGYYKSIHLDDEIRKEYGID